MGKANRYIHGSHRLKIDSASMGINSLRTFNENRMNIWSPAIRSRDFNHFSGPIMRPPVTQSARRRRIAVNYDAYDCRADAAPLDIDAPLPRLEFRFRYQRYCPPSGSFFDDRKRAALECGVSRQQTSIDRRRSVSPALRASRVASRHPRRRYPAVELNRPPSYVRA